MRAPALRSAVLASSRGPAAKAWLAAHGALARIVAEWLRAGTAATVYVRGSTGHGDPIPGLSDVDLVALVGGVDGRSRLEARRRRLGAVARHVSVGVYTQQELAAATASTVLTHGLEGRDGDPHARALYLAPGPPPDEVGLRARPPLPDPSGAWRRLAGPERRPPARRYAPDERLTAAWLELQYWWRHAGRLAASPARPDARHMTVKLLAGPARAMAWLEDDADHPQRRDALEWLRRRHPEEEDAAGAALRLERGSAPAGDELDAVLGALTRLTASVAAAHRRAAPGADSVRLIDGPLLAAGAALPLADWRARCAPALPDEAFRLAAGDPGSAADVRACAAGDGPVGVLRSGELLVMPAAGAVVMRGVQSAVSDPVSAALVEGRREALFHDLPGWRVRDCALRAVAEHRSWLARRAGGDRPNERALGLLLTASRAATFLACVEDGEPRLALTAAAAVDEHERLSPAAGAAAHAALDELTRCRQERRRPHPPVVAAFEHAVRGLPAYGRAAAVAA